ncbi:TPA: hypothetical protein ROY17_002001 [Bacillus thuringiensis]|nr:hypothetical protein [Bacillus thuringiensis]
MRIALCGEARSGKDTVAKLTGLNRLAFGDYMKKAYYNAHPDQVGKPKDREHMIAFSQPIVDVYPEVWVNMLALEMELADDLDTYGPYPWVITDLRQPHEEQWCRENGFHIVRVHSSVANRMNRAYELKETLGNDLPYWVEAEYHLYNDGSLEDLQSQVDNLLDCLNDIEAKRRRL